MVVLLAFLIILAVFRGLLVAVKAAVLNVLSITASYGVVVAVFQWGWGGPALGVHGDVPIESYVPMMMFAIIFGLSMDYEIFLLSRVHEAWLRTGDAKDSVAHALEITARVITCAALIMVSVFSAFIISDNIVVKMLGLGLAVSVLIDATVVRLLMVPAVMTLLGARAWWTPHWLDRILPHIDAEGDAENLSGPPGGPPDPCGSRTSIVTSSRTAGQWRRTSVHTRSPVVAGSAPAGEGGQPVEQGVEDSGGVPGLRDAVGGQEEAVAGAQRQYVGGERGALRETEPQRRPRDDVQLRGRALAQQHRRGMPADDHAHGLRVRRELQQDRRREQLGVRHPRRVHRQPPVQPGGDPRQVRLVEHRLPERPQERGHRRHRRQPVSLDVAEHRPHPVIARPDVEEVTADQRPALGRPVQTRAAHRTHPLGDRRHDGVLRGLGDRALGVQLVVPTAADVRHEHAQHRDERHRQHIGLARLVELERGQVEHHDHGRAEQRGGRRTVRQDRQRRDRAQHEPDVQRLGAGQGGDTDARDQQERQRPYPARGRRAPQPAPPVPVESSHTPTFHRGRDGRTPKNPWTRSRAAP